MAIDYNAGITSLDTGASDITYSGNQGPKSPDQERQMAFDDTPGFELRSLEELLDEFRQDNNGRDPTSIDDLRRHFYIKYGPQGIAKIDKAVQQAEQQAQMQQREGIQMASAADPMLEEQYQQYVFEMQEQGMQPMSLEEFRQQAVAGMATGGRAGYRFGGHPGASHEGEGSGQTHGGTASGSPHAPGGGGDPQGKQSISVGYGQGKVDPGLAAAAGIGQAAAGFAGTTNVGEGGGPADFPLGDSPNAGEGPITYGQNEYQNLIVPGLLDKEKRFRAIQRQKIIDAINEAKEEAIGDFDFSNIEGQQAKLKGLALAQKRVLEKKKGMSDLGGPEFTPTDQKFLDKLIEMDKEEKVYSKPILTAKAEQLSLPGWGIYDKPGLPSGYPGTSGSLNKQIATGPDPYLPGLEPINTMMNPVWNNQTQTFEYPMKAAQGGIARLGYANGQLVKPGPGRPGYQGPAGGSHDTYGGSSSPYSSGGHRGGGSDRDPAPAPSFGISPGQSTAQFGHAGHAGKTESQAKAHQASGIDTPGGEPSGVGVTSTGTLPPVVDEKAEAEKAEIEALKKEKLSFKTPLMWALEQAKKFKVWNNLMQRKKHKEKYEEENPHPMGFVWDDWTDEEWLEKDIGEIPGYREYLDRFKQPGGGGGGGDGPQPIIYPYQTASASVPGTDTPVDIDPVTGFPTGPITGQLGGIPEANLLDLEKIYNTNRAGLAPMFTAADGGRIGYAGGGIADLRQGYFLGKLVKKAGRALKKVAKSPIGRMGLMALGGWGLNKWNPGGILDKKGFFAPLLRKNIGTKDNPVWGGFNPWKLGILGMSAYPLVASMGKEEDEDFTDTDLYKKWLAQKQGWDQTFAPVGDPANWKRMRLYSADGGRIGYDSGGDVMMASYDYNDAMAESFEAYQKAIKDGIIPPTMEFDEYLELMQGRKEIAPQGIQMAAQGGRIGYDEGKKVLPHRTAALSAMYRTKAQEGGLMDMGGMEKDYRNEGGFVPIGGQERADDVPARLSKNEFVFTADAVRNAGGGDIDKGAEIMENLMENLEQGGKVSEESQGLEGARNMFATSQRLEGVL